jgi:hypothetical protein
MESEDIKVYIQELLYQGVIKPSASPCEYPIVLASKDGIVECMFIFGYSTR